MAKIDLGKVVGADGKSAYQIAVEHGFEGTEQEWIDSLNYDEDIYALDEKINQEIEDRTNADDNLQNQIDSINEKIPEAATADNQLADKQYVLNKIASNSGSFIGAFSSFEELQNYEGTLVKNDYAFVITIETSLKSYKRYQWTGSEWKFEYDLNNSSFTDEQWEAINSNVTATWKTNVDSSLSELNNKQDKLTEIQLRNSADFINCNSGQSAAIQYFKIAETAYRETSYDTFQLEGFVSSILGNNERNYFAINIVNRGGTSPYHSISGFLQKDRKDWNIEIYTNEAGDKREIYFITSASWVSFNGNCVNYTNNGSIVLNNLPTSSTTAPTGTLLGKLSASTELQIIGNKADKSHTHDDRYYTESEIDTKLSGKADSSHGHTSLKRTEIAAGTDLNTLTNPGEYYAIANTSYTNAPCQNFVMQTISMFQGWKFQKIYAYATGKIYTRTTYYSSGNTVWSSWREHTSRNEVFGTDLSNYYYYSESTGIKFYWYKIIDSSSFNATGKRIKLKFKLASDNNHLYKSEYVLDVSHYMTTTTKNLSISLKNIYADANRSESNMVVAIDEDYNVYAQFCCVWESYVNITKELGNINFKTEKLSYSTFGIESSDFTPKQKITRQGKCKIDKNLSTGAYTVGDVGDTYTFTTSSKAIADASGNNIVNTYATKTELTNWNIANANYTGNPNDCEIGKWYSINTVTNSTNMPRVDGWANVITFAANNNSSYKQQLCFYNNAGAMYIRTQIAGAWGSWGRVAKSSELDGKADISHTHDELAATKLPSGTDLNSVNFMAYDCKEFYSVDDGTYSNAPSNSFTLRLIETENGGCVQLFCSHENSTVKLYSRAHLRVVDNYYWTEWSSLANSDEIESTYATKTELSGKANSTHTHKSLDFTVIPAEADLDTYKVPGLYVSTANKNFVNTPTSTFTNFSLEVYRLLNENYVAQRITRYATNEVWVRTQYYNSGSVVWSSWTNYSKVGHTHDDRYYTETEIDTKLSTYALKSDLANAGMSVSAKNVMEATGSIDFNTNKATIQLPIYSSDATDQPTALGAMWIQEVKEDEE